LECDFSFLLQEGESFVVYSVPLVRGGVGWQGLSEQAE